ncbi:hypothetical protein [Moorena sp. SIO4G3]|uniref:hypothetical protein n=1 Tax=Moorena sp. SIO4G3 TaxID=2607821 RepID=UPI0025CE6513|nr:hypothetical protein [Moorena sp. SIO4G3]
MRCSLALAYWPRYANGPRGARLEPLREPIATLSAKWANRWFPNKTSHSKIF